MPQPFKFRYVNEIAGVFVLLAVLLVIAGVLLAGHAQRWFEPVERLTLIFPEEGSLGLQKGAEVRILGARIGSVEEITVAEDGSMAGKLRLSGDLIRFIRADSKATVKKTFGIAGDAYVELTKGESPDPPPYDTLPCEKDTEITEVIENIISQVQTAVVPMIDQIRKAVEEYTNLAADMRSPEGNLQQLLGNLAGITAGIQKGEGAVGQILRDPDTSQQIRETIKGVNRSVEQLRRILADVQQATAKLPDIAGTVSDQSKDLPELVLQTEDALRETTRLIEGLQKHWLIRKYVEQVEPVERIAPAAVGGAPGGTAP